MPKADLTIDNRLILASYLLDEIPWLPGRRCFVNRGGPGTPAGLETILNGSNRPGTRRRSSPRRTHCGSRKPYHPLAAHLDRGYARNSLALQCDFLLDRIQEDSLRLGVM